MTKRAHIIAFQLLLISLLLHWGCKDEVLAPVEQPTCDSLEASFIGQIAFQEMKLQGDDQLMYSQLESCLSDPDMLTEELYIINDTTTYDSAFTDLLGVAEVSSCHQPRAYPDFSKQSVLFILADSHVDAIPKVTACVDSSNQMVTIKFSGSVLTSPEEEAERTKDNWWVLIEKLPKGYNYQLETRIQ